MARILVIDDDASLLQMMSLMLKRAGHDPLMAHDGQEGIEIARREQPDLAIVDIMMPDLSGYDVCTILRQDPLTSSIPLLVLTALTQPEHKDVAAESGADDFVTKPVTRDDLVGRVDELLVSGPRNQPVMYDAAPSADDYRAVSPPDLMKGTGQPVEMKPSARPPATQHYAASLLPVIAVMGLNTGVGTTMMAINLAYALNQHARVCLVDFNSQIGQVAVQMRMVPPRTTWQQLVGMPRGADKRNIGSALLIGHQTNLVVMAGPMKPVEKPLAPESTEYILEVLSEGFQHVVVDLAPALDPMNLAVLRRASDIVLVIGNDPAGLMTASGALSSLARSGIPGQVHVVLNHTRPQGVSFDQVNEVVNRPLAANVPYEPAQVQALIKGIPLVADEPDSLFSRTIVQFAKMLHASGS